MREPLRKGWCPGALRPMMARDGLIVRVRPTNGILPATTARAIAGCAERWGNGALDLTARANMQLRGVTEPALPELRAALRDLGLLDASAAGEAVRNVVASPLAGLGTGLDIRPLVAALEARLASDPALHALPTKFGFLVDDGGTPSLAAVDADVRFTWVEADNLFMIGLGGGEATAIGSCGAGDLVGRAAAIARAALGLFARTDSRRMRGLLDSFGPYVVARTCGGMLALEHRTASRTRCSPPPRHAGRRVSRDPKPVFTGADRWRAPVSGSPPAPRNDASMTPSDALAPARGADVVGRRTFGGVATLGLAAPFGALDAAMLRSAAAIAARTAAGELRLTPWRTILIPGAEGPCPDAAGFIVDGGDPRLAVSACVGQQGCARGTTPTRADAALLAASLSAGASLHVSGCAKGCAKAAPSTFTLVGRDGRYDLVRDGRAGDAAERLGLDLAQIRDALAPVPA